MSMNVNTTGTVYGSYQNTYKAGTVDKKKETAKTTENDKVKKNVTESIAEKNLSKEAQKMLKDMRGSRTDMDFMVADFENGDNAKDILAQSDKEFTVIFSKEEMEKMASDPKYYAEKMHSIEGALRMSDEINAQFGFERAFGKTNGIENSADTDTKITKFGISFNSDGTTTFFAQLEKTSASQKEYLEKIQEKKAAEKKEAKKKEQLKQIEVKKATVQANSKDELLVRKRFFSIIVCVVMLFTMNVTAFAAETQENYSETEKTMTFEITPTALTSGSSRHSVGMLNSFFGTNDTVATSALGSFTISSTSVPSGSTISKIVVTSTKSSGSSGNIELFVAKDEDNGDGTFDRYTDSKSWNSSLTFADFGNYNLSPVGNYYVQFESTRYSTGTVAAATLKNIYVTVYYH